MKWRICSRQLNHNMSASRKGQENQNDSAPDNTLTVDNPPQSQGGTKSAKKGGSSHNAAAARDLDTSKQNSSTLMGTGAAAIQSPNYSSQLASQIPMAEPVAEISGNRQDKLLQAPMPMPTQNFSGLGLMLGEKGLQKPKKKGGASMESRLDYACEALGFNKQQLIQVQSIDFCLDDICRIDWLVHFPNIKELIIVNQGISEIEGIDKCKLLEKVWLTCNHIEQIRLIDRLSMLRQLFLGTNKIRRIRCLDKAIYLEKLWLDENRIEHIDGISNLTNLVELNLAKNNIESIGIGLDGLSSLRELNLSANRIGNFKEVLNLNRLPNLAICTFSDPHYGENPICSLCNYQTYVLFHLPKLIRLDTMIVSEESKNFAETTFMKKRMYYNMRIKTIQRNTSNIMKLLKICCKVRICKIDIQTSKLIKKLLEITRELEERQYIDQKNKDEFEPVWRYGPEKLTQNPLDKIDHDQLVSDIENKKALIQGHMHDKNEDLKDLETIYESLRRKIYEMSEQNIHRLMTELETGGNIRFEEGRPQDRWFSSCVDLVRSRFSAEQMKHFGIIGINVTRVTRIHNRFLRNRFEEKLEQLVDLSDNQYKRSLEYLFYGINPQAPKEIHRAMEEGFRSIQEYNEAGLPGCISLVNSVASAEIARINQFLKGEDGMSHVRAAAKAARQTELRADQALTVEKGLVQIPSGQLLVCKIFLQKCTHDSNHPHFNPSHSPSEIWKYAPVDERKNAGVQSVYRTKENDPKQRMWFVLDHALALPEYLVEFDYITNPKSVAENRRLAETNVINEECNNLFKGITETQRVLEQTQIWVQKENTKSQTIHLTAQDLDRSDMGCLKRPLHNFMVTCHIQELMNNRFEFTEDEKTGQAAVENSMPPEIPMRSQIEMITQDIIVSISRERDLDRIIYLNLFNNKIKKIENLDNLVNLQTLILSFNEIEEIEGLSKNVNLRKLDLNHNFIRFIRNLDALANLTQLDLRHNWIADINCVDKIEQHCKSLTELGLKCNPMSSKKSYRSIVFGKMAILQKLDGKGLDEKETGDSGEQGAKELSYDMIVDQLKSQKKNFQLDGTVPGDGDSSNPNGAERQVEELCLNHMQICRIQNLEPFVNLRKLKLLDNNIQVIAGLENLRVLEELSLEKNKLTGIQNLENLKYLKKLDLGSNKIKRISNVHMLVSLTQLSLENNEISRLDGLEELQCLMELYLGNNLISDVKETIKLKDLQRLIILDISGNLMSSSFGNNYRIYCIFHLRKLRVLDGMSIDPQEHLEAKETFSGRLTEEILNSRLNGRRLSEMRELDLSSCKLRDFEDMFDQNTCPQLRELNLSHNQMSSLKGFGYLPQLKILRLRDNRLETLFCKPAPDDKNFRRGLFGMPGLELLDVTQNQLQYLYGLQYSPLKELKMLFAANNEIVKIEHLEKLRQLRELDLSKNRIRQIDMNSFHHLHVIVCLRLDDNGLRSLANIEKLEKLQTLFVSGNRIQELFEIEKLAELPHLLELSLTQTPIARKPNYRMIVVKRLAQLLVLDGKEITMDERKRIEGQTGGMIDPKSQAPLVHFQQYPTVKVPVKLNPVNFDGVFNNIKFQMEQQSPQGQVPQLTAMQGGFQKGAPGADMNSLIQVQSLQMGQAGIPQPGQIPSQTMQQQMQQMAGGGAPPALGGMSGGLGVDMGGMLINSQFNRQQHMQMQMAQQQQQANLGTEFNYSNEPGRKGLGATNRRPSTNKLQNEQNQLQQQQIRQQYGHVPNTGISVSSTNLPQNQQFQQYQALGINQMGLPGGHAPVSQGNRGGARNMNQKQQLQSQPLSASGQNGTNVSRGTIQQIINGQTAQSQVSAGGGQQQQRFNAQKR